MSLMPPPASCIFRTACSDRWTVGPWEARQPMSLSELQPRRFTYSIFERSEVGGLGGTPRKRPWQLTTEARELEAEAIGLTVLYGMRRCELAQAQAGPKRTWRDEIHDQTPHGTVGPWDRGTVGPEACDGRPASLSATHPFFFFFSPFSSVSPLGDQGFLWSLYAYLSTFFFFFFFFSWLISNGLSFFFCVGFLFFRLLGRCLFQSLR